MTRKTLHYVTLVLAWSCYAIPCNANAALLEALRTEYEYHVNVSSDIHEHLPTLRTLARECCSVVELGLRTMESTWGILQGLAETHSSHRSYLGIDLSIPPEEILNKAKTLAQQNGISFCFLQANDLTVDLPPTDMLFIDTLHTYCQLTSELEKFSSQVAKFIAMHDTSGPWGEVDDAEYCGNYSEYPAWIDRTQRGLWAAVRDFLQRHPEWELKARYLNCNGLTVLQRVGSDK